MSPGARFTYTAANSRLELEVQNVKMRACEANPKRGGGAALRRCALAFASRRLSYTLRSASPSPSSVFAPLYAARCSLSYRKVYVSLSRAV